MARDGSGNFSLLSVLAPPGATNDPTTINAIMDDIATALSGSINTAGTKPWAANQPMAGFKLTGLGDGTAASDSASLSQVQKGNKNLATVVGGTVDAITLTFSPPIAALSAGMEIKWISAGANTITGVNIAIDAIGGTKILKKGASAALAVGDTGVSGYLNKATYNGTDWIQDNPASSTSFIGGALSLTTSMTGKPFNQAKGAAVASAATTDIWTPADGNLVHVTGVTGITSFGTAPQAGAMREIIFDGILTITNNATSLILNNGGANYTTAAGDRAFVFADTTANMIVTIVPVSGSSPAGGGKVPHRTVVTAGVTYTTPVGCTLIDVEVVGGGGGGGDSGAANSGQGGGGGGRAKKLYTVVGNTAYTIAIGAGGTASNDGGNTTFTDGVTLITGLGGKQGADNRTSVTTAALGGFATNGTVNEPGASGDVYFSSLAGAAGARGFNGPGGAGGASNNNGGAAGANTGAGGGGAGDNTHSGGPGGSGYIVVIEYY